ncbi:hypothetical protein PVA44_02485 [Entomospira nematocerorum]|uniref:Uncharacterized protein n=1 Tax=Entomospira nematocerorum TaxID=2719987 RepID=A0A968GC64_9SPIO|nr:hypothetical protein [Entomospira nematocera]NIZ47099.1 hypothetical protein [Entomospira nematocera]WDI34356.1 hypothetical protein PVA44_02485 [Entomospira nematocera]
MVINNSWIKLGTSLLIIASLFSCNPKPSATEESIVQKDSSISINAGPRGYEQGRVFFKLVHKDELKENANFYKKPTKKTVEIDPKSNINAVMEEELLFPVRYDGSLLFSNFTAPELPLVITIEQNKEAKIGPQFLSTNQKIDLPSGGQHYIRFGNFWTTETTNIFNDEQNWKVGDQFYIVFFLVSTVTYFNTDMDNTIDPADKQKVIKLQINPLNTENENLLNSSKYTIKEAF